MRQRKDFIVNEVRCSVNDRQEIWEDVLLEYQFIIVVVVMHNFMLS
jgi:hypothetical protein